MRRLTLRDLLRKLGESKIFTKGECIFTHPLLKKCFGIVVKVLLWHKKVAYERSFV